MGKCLGLDTGMAMMGIDPGNVDKIPALPILADIIRRDEDLRHAGQVPEPIKERLRQQFPANGKGICRVGKVAASTTSGS